MHTDQPNRNASLKKPRIVLDTNVCLDLFVFRDPRWQQLWAAMQEKTVACVTSASCRMEWTLVLNYEKLGIEEIQQKNLSAEFDALISVIPDQETVIALPVCRDQDDQKFLVAAHTAQADFLITKDKALLKLARKTARMGLFQILSPENWITLCFSQNQMTTLQT